MKYAIAISAQADGAVTIQVPDVPECVVVEPTVEKAVERIVAALASHRQRLRLNGEELPPPRALEDHKAEGTFGDAVRWDTVELDDAPLSPRDFMRARRPELYSDSSMERRLVVDKTFLNFVLAQLTEEKKEIQFETFCRKLAEKEICPNLLPQTGPTGGGDSKVDSETYPVSEAIAERWYVGDPQKAAKERWAFAISAKKDWRPKVRNDVRKVVETNRAYTVVYFITNQQVSDRNRSALEDELRGAWGVDVRILDRSWITEKVLASGHYDLFESTLQVDLGGTTTRSLGPADAERERELAELEGQIQDQSRYAGVHYQLAQDCLDAALLARGLDRQRVELDGLFERADGIARKYGNERQLLWITYHRAWTAFFWHEDYAEFDRLYRTAESLGIHTDNVWDLERLALLWQLGTTWRRTEGTLARDEDWRSRTGELRSAIRHLVDREERPTSSLVARTLLTLMAMISEGLGADELRSHLEELGSILEATERHPDYPFDSTARIVEEAVNMSAGDERLDGILDKVIEMRRQREGDTEEGRQRLRRALACAQAQRHLEAIRQAGKAQTLLVGDDDDGELLVALMTTGRNYEAVGLLWAARANYAFALHRVLQKLHTTGELPPTLYHALNRLIWVEIQLGRVSQVLAWLELHANLANVVDVTENRMSRLAEEYAHMDAVLAIVVLRTRWEDLAKLDRAPAVFDRFGLPACRVAMMFLLGYSVAAAHEGHIDDPEGFFRQLLAQPAAHDVSESADWNQRRPFTLRTTLFGCQIYVLVQSPHSLPLGETLLAFLEAFVATSDLTQFRGNLSPRPELWVEVVIRDEVDGPFDYELVEDKAGDVKIVVAHRDGMVSPAHKQYSKKMVELFANVMAQLWLPYLTEDVEALFTEERAQDRASLAAQLPIMLNDILGGTPKFEAQDWTNVESESFTLCRTSPWRANQEARPDRKGKEISSGVDAIRHRDLSVLSVINGPLWDKAEWSGMAYLFARQPNDVPCVLFLFKNIDSGQKIFHGWLKKFGADDPNDTIDITLITGINGSHRDWYRVVVGYRLEELESTSESRTRLFGSSLRIHEMTPQDGTNLSQFIERYRRIGRYRIGPIEHRAMAGLIYSRPSVLIEKRRLNIVHASSVNPDSVLGAALKD